uniref:Uncharacterized protein n=1 Tax=Rhizophora mucronata TaxID=61149 RepID=A0A2P2R2X8_RHIMU
MLLSSLLDVSLVRSILSCS